MNELQKNIVDREVSGPLLLLVMFPFMYKFKIIKQQLHRYYLYSFSSNLSLFYMRDLK